MFIPLCLQDVSFIFKLTFAIQSNDKKGLSR